MLMRTFSYWILYSFIVLSQLPFIVSANFHVLLLPILNRRVPTTNEFCLRRGIEHILASLHSLRNLRCLSAPDAIIRPGMFLLTPKFHEPRISAETLRISPFLSFIFIGTSIENTQRVSFNRIALARVHLTLPLHRTSIVHFLRLE